MSLITKFPKFQFNQFNRRLFSTRTLPLRSPIIHESKPIVDVTYQIEGVPLHPEPGTEVAGEKFGSLMRSPFSETELEAKPKIPTFGEIGEVSPIYGDYY